MAKTEVFEEKLNPSLTCKEKIIKKLKRNLKSGSEDLHANQHYRICIVSHYIASIVTDYPQEIVR